MLDWPVFNLDEWGTVWDWTIGLMVGATTALLAGMAWYQAKQAAFWARRAAEAEERANEIQSHANRLKEAELEPQFEVVLAASPREVELSEWTELWVALEAGSRPVWVRGARIESTNLRMHPPNRLWDEYPDDFNSYLLGTPEPIELEFPDDGHPDVALGAPSPSKLPYRLRAAETAGIMALNPFDDDLKPSVALLPESWMFVSVDYSHTNDGTVYTSVRVPVDLASVVRPPMNENEPGGL